MITEQPISIDEMKVRCLIASTEYDDTAEVRVLNDEIYWLRDGQWWDYPRMSETSPLMIDLIKILDKGNKE